MSKFDRYMLSQLMMLFGFFALVLVSVYWINRAVSLFDQLISDGQSAWVFLEFTALTLPNVIRLVLPVAAFVASVYVTNRLASESELVVMMATGFSPFRAARSSWSPPSACGTRSGPLETSRATASSRRTNQAPNSKSGWPRTDPIPMCRRQR